VTTTKKALIAGFLAAITGTGLYQTIEIRGLRVENETLRQQITDEREMLSRYFAISKEISTRKIIKTPLIRNAAVIMYPRGG
jgi:hypothetical protein